MQSILCSNTRLLQHISEPDVGLWQKINTPSAIIDWFALYFTRNSAGSSSATSVQSEPGQITLHVALESTVLSLDQDGTTKTGLQALQRLIALKTAPRIHRQLRKLLDVNTYCSSKEVASYGLSLAFKHALSYWKERGNLERSPRCLELSGSKFGDEDHGVDVLKDTFATLLTYAQEAVDIMNTDYNPDRWLYAIEKVWECLATTMLSDAFRFVDAVFGHCVGHDFTFMNQVYKRALRVHSEDGVQRFVRGDGGVQICWVNDLPSSLPSIGKPFQYSTTPAAHLNTLIESCALRSRHRLALREKLRMCWACQQYLGIIHPKETVTQLQQASGKTKCDWIPPPTSDGERVVDVLILWFLDAVSLQMDLVMEAVDGSRLPKLMFRDEPSEAHPELEELKRVGLTGWSPRTEHITN
ncbi:hypothetical protein CERSUDRAFT_69639 [Gelatoporia subvermispora B]|uniref:Uncharacterized protein n=1 Tax=Ceriporiopsis subvermispora (strain B) TaxID=914234 RepID=M2QG51_CERS8|nr:hypothetical protein CERSUDRAFT_69639 [Gelatoporia subvermispora B]